MSDTDLVAHVDDLERQNAELRRQVERAHHLLGGSLIAQEWGADDPIYGVNERGDPYLISTARGTYLLAAYVREYTLRVHEMNALNIQILHAALTMDGQRARTYLAGLSGQLAAAFKRYSETLAAMALPRDEPVYDYVRLVERALQAVAESGDLAPIKTLAQDASAFSSLFKDLPDIPTRGHRPMEARSALLRELLLQVHRPGQRWVDTGAALIERLEPLKDMYPECEYDIQCIRQAVDVHDAEALKVMLRHHLKAAQRSKRGRAGR